MIKQSKLRSVKFTVDEAHCESSVEFLHNEEKFKDKFDRWKSSQHI
jgi:hypothetical protein